MKNVDKIINDNEIPSYVDITIEEAKNKIKRENKIKKKAKNISIYAAASISILFGLGIYNPSMAKEIPVLHSLFEDLNQRFNLNGAFITGVQKIGQTKTIGDISFTINESIYDGANIYISYTVESKKDLTKEDMGYGLYDTEVSNNIGANIYQYRGLSGYYKDSKTYIGGSQFKVDYINNTHDKLNINLEIGKIGLNTQAYKDMFSGPWKFSLDLDNNIDVETFNINQNNDGYKVDNIRISKFGMVFNLEIPSRLFYKETIANEENSYQPQSGFLDIYDENNKLLYREGLYKDNYKIENNMVKMQPNFNFEDGKEGSRPKKLLLKFYVGKVVELDINDERCSDENSFVLEPIQREELVEISIDLN